MSDGKRPYRQNAAVDAGAAYGRALRRLRDLHRDEFDALYEAEKNPADEGER